MPFEGGSGHLCGAVAGTLIGGTSNRLGAGATPSEVDRGAYLVGFLG